MGDPAARFREDYLRILRGIRFAARFGFRIEPATWQAAVAAAPGLSGLSAERVREEWFKGLRTARSMAELIRLWHDVGAAKIWLPELDPWSFQEPAVRDPVVLTAVLVRNPRGRAASPPRVERGNRPGPSHGAESRRLLWAKAPSARDAGSRVSAPRRTT